MATRLDISKQLAKLMRDQGLSQSALSRATGVPQPTINRILSEVTREPRRDSVVRIANYFNVTPESLYQAPNNNPAASRKKESIEDLFDLISNLDDADRNALFEKVAKEIT
ncbi:MAG: helix-turn-helix domain-containing protein [Porticoccaceae bacterium]